MKNSISKATLLLLCSAFALFSCTKPAAEIEQTVTMEYRILVTANQSYLAGSNNGGIEKLNTYIVAEMDAVSKVYDIAWWKITKTAATEAAAIKACEQEAVALFDEKIVAINVATAAVKAKFDAKKAELLSEITLEPTSANITYTNYSGALYKSEGTTSVVVKEGKVYDMKAVGGEK